MEAGMEYLMHVVTSLGYYGYVILFVVILLESFPLTFWLPGESLLFATGFLASQGYFDLTLLTFTFFVASVLGYMFSYYAGEWLRNFILKSNNKYWFKTEHLEYTEEFYKKYGDKTIIIGRFVTIVRSFSPTLAGSAKMPYQKFIRHTFVGGILWSGAMTSVGYYLGKLVPGADKYLTPLVVVVVIFSLSPTVFKYLKSRWDSRVKKTI